MLVLAVCLAYGLGCLSPGWWLVRRTTGTDLRETGSGGTGATNAARVLGGSAFFVILLLDSAKAAIAVLGGLWLARDNPWHVLTLPAVIAGHIWPAPLKFKGGRGAGPLLGGAIALNPWFLVAAIVPASLALAVTRRRIAVTTAAAGGGIIAAAWLLPQFESRLAFAAAVALVLFAHRSYLTRGVRRAVP